MMEVMRSYTKVIITGKMRDQSDVLPVLQAVQQIPEGADER
tara:strand:+ start:9598 stop:9720 length:123 start_codon:yes stop_codon:yes gene_type:complete